MPRSLRYDKAEILRGRIADLLHDLSDFVDAEEDSIEDGRAAPDPVYIDSLAEACLLLDQACTAMESI